MKQLSLEVEKEKLINDFAALYLIDYTREHYKKGFWFKKGDIKVHLKPVDNTVKVKKVVLTVSAARNYII